jgi:hypothetical protein
VSSGATLYLVSACATAEQFVAAFRRYADRTGLFVPTAAPLPAGRRGQLALTLANGGVMIAGEAEILQSSAKPTVLHGRPGMTVKFVAPDELSKAAIADLEKARLALKPAPPSVAPRPAEVPAEPRPVVPAIGGRIDAAKALAECVVIGDAAALVETKAAPSIGSLAVPAIPAAPPRLKQPTAPPEPSRSKPTSIGFPILDKKPAATTPDALLETVRGTTPAPNRTAITPALVVPEDESTTIGSAPAKAPSTGEGVARSARAFETQPVGTVRPAPPVLPPRSKGPTRPPLSPRHPTPVAPVPIVRPPAKRAPTVDDAVVENAIVEEEKTDLGEAPQPLATAATTDPAAEPTIPATPLDVAPQPSDKKQRSGGMRASEIMAAIPEGDWTMAPDAPEPTALPPKPAEPPKGPPTGNWTISLDPETGWSEPKKLDPSAAPPTPPATPPRQRVASGGNPVVAVAKDEGFEAVAWEDKPTHLGDKIEIDAALMEAASEAAPPPAFTAPPPVNAAPPPPAFAMAPPPSPPPPLMPAQPYMGAHPYSPVQTYATRSRGPRRTLIIAAVAGGAVAVAVVLVLALSGGKSNSNPPVAKVATPAPLADAAVEVAVPDAAIEQVVEQPPQEPPPLPAATTCKATITSSPKGAAIYQGDTKLGTTPASLELQCGVEVKLTLKKSKYSPAQRAFTPADGKANKVSVRLAKPTFAVKVTSTPPGATITVGRRSMGVTPASIRLTAYEATTIVISKPGYTSVSRSVTPKSNNTLQSVVLKKGRR